MTLGFGGRTRRSSRDFFYWSRWLGCSSCGTFLAVTESARRSEMMIADSNITWNKKRTTFTLLRLLAAAEIILIAGFSLIPICTSGKKREKRSSGSILVQLGKGEATTTSPPEQLLLQTSIVFQKNPKESASLNFLVT